MSEAAAIAGLKVAALNEAKAAAERVTGLKGNTALARVLSDASAKSVTPQAISQWSEVPLGRVFEVEQATRIPRHRLRPDFFEAPEAIAS
jgi:DNA-binding transcriptional regulator YdaS (Cro superfamily)